MSAGRNALPAQIKSLQGTDRKDRQHISVEFTPLTICPKAEVWLEDKAKKYFTNTCKLLIGKKLLTDGNLPLVTMMAQEFATYEQSVRELKIGGYVITTGKNDYEQPSPWVAIRNQSQKNYREIASLFGLDPISAMKVGGSVKSEKDDFEQMEKKYS